MPLRRRTAGVLAHGPILLVITNNVKTNICSPFSAECSLLPRWERSTTTGITPKCRSCGEQREKNLEARVGIEPTHKGFADLSLTTWVPRPCPTLAFRAEKVHFCRELAGLKAKIWSGRRGSNPRH